MDDVPIGPQQSATQQFFELFIEEVGKGYTRESTLKDESWEFICHQLNRDYAGGVRLFNVQILKENMLHYRRQYNYFSALLALDGVQWDMRTNEVKAERSVWKAYYKAQPNAPSYYRRGEKYFDLLCHIFESGVHFD